MIALVIVNRALNFGIDRFRCPPGPWTLEDVIAAPDDGCPTHILILRYRSAAQASKELSRDRNAFWRLPSRPLTRHLRMREFDKDTAVRITHITEAGSSC
jgi:hypothetical protein